MLFLSFKSKFYTNKFDQKELFTAKKLFKPHFSQNKKLKNKHKEVLKVIKEDENESYDVESIRYRPSCHTATDRKDSQTIERYSHNSHIDGERMQQLVRRNSNSRKSGDEPEIKSAFSTEKSSDKKEKIKYIIHHMTV